MRFGLSLVCCSYYEWQTGADGSKQPYFIYQPVVDQPAPQKLEYVESVSVDDVRAELGCNTKGFFFPSCFCDILHITKRTFLQVANVHALFILFLARRLLMMAGLFDVWQPKVLLVI